MSVMVVHPDPLLGDALAALIGGEGSFDVSGAWSSVKDAIAAAGNQAVLVVSDSASGGSAPAELAKWKSKGGALVVIAASSTVESDLAEVADAVVRQNAGSQLLFQKLESLGIRRRGLHVAEASAAYAGIRLSKNEQRAASYLIMGHSNRAIAEAMGVSEMSVKNYFRQLMKKLGCKNRVQLLLKLSR